MKLKNIIFSVVAVVMISSLASCGEKNNEQSDNVIAATTADPNEAIVATEAPTEQEIIIQTVEPTTVIAAADGPRLSIKDSTGKAGEFAEITVHVENADMKWNMCGLHITYPDVLEPEMIDVEDGFANYTKGDASNYASAAICKKWEVNMPDELTSENLGCIFFTEVFDGNKGLDGDIFSFYLRIPKDAESGTVYPLGFYYLDTDKFSNKEGDLAVEKYVFENWQGGSLTVE